jgi:hypothetical protein
MDTSNSRPVPAASVFGRVAAGGTTASSNAAYDSIHGVPHNTSWTDPTTAAQLPTGAVPTTVEPRCFTINHRGCM